MIQLKSCSLLAAGVLILTMGAVIPRALGIVRDGPPSSDAVLKDRSESQSPVRALFDLDHPDAGPFPADVFTLEDRAQNTGRRVQLPYPDCTAYPSNCDDLDTINTLDGFSLQTRLSIPFDGSIDPSTVTSDTVFLISLGSTLGHTDHRGGRVVGINQIVWDAIGNTLHVESDELLAQHTRYALIVTNGVRDASGRPINASRAFRDFRKNVRGSYKHDLLNALHAARRLGVRERQIVTASVYTTQSITPVMERIRDEIKAAMPAAANFRVGPNGERAVFDRGDVTGITWRRHTTVSPAGFTTVDMNLALLDVFPGAIGGIAFGTFQSPVYRVPGEYIPAVSTRSGVPPVQGHEEIAFTLFLPSGVQPAAGWPIAILGVPTDRHAPMAAMAATLASHGIATIGIHTAGCGFGPLSTLTITLRNGGSLTIPDRGRSIDQNGDNVIGVTEGSIAAPPRAWTIGERDGYRQTAIDLIQLVRVIESGVDVDDDAVWELDPRRIFHFGFSAGAMHGTMFLALEPAVSIAVESSAGGMVPEHARWSTVRRPVIGAALQGRLPSLINAPGIASIDGVPVGGPHFDEDKPLRGLPPVINTIDGAMEIQRAFEIQEWAQQAGQSPIVWAPFLRTSPLANVGPKSVIYQFSSGDQQAINPGTTAFLRAGGLADRAVQYRHDLALAEDGSLPKNPHTVLVSAMHPNPTFRTIARALQAQAAVFLASGGSLVVHPEPARFFDVPVLEPLPEALNFIR